MVTVFEVCMVNGDVAVKDHFFEELDKEVAQIRPGREVIVSEVVNGRMGSYEHKEIVWPFDEITLSVHSKRGKID